MAQLLWCERPLTSRILFIDGLKVGPHVKAARLKRLFSRALRESLVFPINLRDGVFLLR